MDFKYSYSKDPLAAKLFPGHVHSGLFDIFKQTYAEVEKVGSCPCHGGYVCVSECCLGFGIWRGVG